MAYEEIDEQNRNCLARETVLMGATALKASLIKVTYIEKPKPYNKREF